MTENKMKKVAELLGVEMGESFKIKGDRCNTFILDEDGLIDCHYCRRNGLLILLLKGECEIEQPILTKKEKRYLESVLKPFKDRIVYAIKLYCGKKQNL